MHSATRTLIAVLVLCSVVALSTQLKCHKCEGTCVDMTEETCTGTQVCVIAQLKTGNTISMYRGCVNPEVCHAGNTRDATPVMGPVAQRLKEFFSRGKTVCNDCKTDLCNGGAAPAFE